MEFGSTVVGVVIGFVLREAWALGVREFEARAGRSGYLPDGYGFYALAETSDGRQIETQLPFPDRSFPDARTFPLTIKGDLYNDTNTNNILMQPVVTLEHPEAEPYRFSNPTLWVAGQRVVTVSVPAHGTVAIRIELTVIRDQLSSMSGRLPILEFTNANQRKVSYRAASSFFFGGRTVIWPRKGKRPIFLSTRTDDFEDT
jgi:hypothetical protein